MPNMNQQVSRPSVIRFSIRNSKKPALLNAKNLCFSIGCDNHTAPISSKVIRHSKQNKIKHQGHENSILAQKESERNQLDLSNSIPSNLIKSSTTYFDLSKTHRLYNRHDRINPINSSKLFNNEFTLDITERNRKKKKNKTSCAGSISKICCSIFILVLLLGGFIGLIIYALNQTKNSETTTTAVSTILTTTQNSVCTTGGLICPTPMFAWNRTNNCTKPAGSYLYYSCCYQAISSQLTIEFLLREDVTNWLIDDASVTQGNGELLINGGFELNLTGWIVTSSIGNLSVTPLAMSSFGSAHSGLSYLYSEGKTTSDRIKQTVNVVQGQNVNISFWWLDVGGTAGPTEICEATVTLTP